MGLSYEHKTNNINLIVKRSHKQTVNRAAHDQRIGKCKYIAALHSRAGVFLLGTQ